MAEPPTNELSVLGYTTSVVKKRVCMTDTVENLILDLLDWLGPAERSYQETMDAWRTSCPRLPVWEDANDRGLVEVATASGVSVVRVTPAGRALLAEKRLSRK